MNQPTQPPVSPALNPQQLRDELAFGQNILAAEAQAIQRITLDAAFHAAIDLIVQSHGSVVVSGLGKSGIVGQKISATLASTGTPSHFLHPTEAMHGDLGRIRRQDVVLLLSYGGNTGEVVDLATILRQDSIPLIAIVGRPGCELARLATVTLLIGEVEEASPYHPAPSTSTTATLALGDALALTVSRRRNFGAEDYRKFHPGGSLGRLLTPVVDAMRFQAGVNIPLIPLTATLTQAYDIARTFKPAIRAAGALLIVDAQGKLAGIFTDGDFRRVIFTHGPTAVSQPIGDLMTKNPKRLTADAMVRDAVQMVREYRIDEVPVVDAAGQPVGLIDVQDLVALKVIEG